MSREIPMLFADCMIRALLDGTKTVTRRVDDPGRFCVGDVLWTREAHAITFARLNAAGHVCAPWDGVPRIVDIENHRVAYFRATFNRSHPRWRPSIHQPRWAARMLLEVTSVDVERDYPNVFTDEEAQREGFGSVMEFGYWWADNGRLGDIVRLGLRVAELRTGGAS